MKTHQERVVEKCSDREIFVKKRTSAYCGSVPWRTTDARSPVLRACGWLWGRALWILVRREGFKGRIAVVNLVLNTRRADERCHSDERVRD